MSRDPKGTLRLVAAGRWYNVEVKARPVWLGTSSAVQLELVRDDAKGCPMVWLHLDEAQAFLRAVQSAVDEAYRRAKEQHKGRGP